MALYQDEESEDEEEREEEILEKLRQHKEIIESVRMKPWRMKKKLQTLRYLGQPLKIQQRNYTTERFLLDKF